MTDTVVAGTADGRSLWATAILRLRRNRAAVASLVVIVVLALAAMAGPPLLPHGYSDVYREFVRVSPSLRPYPMADQIEPAAAATLRRAHVEVTDIVVSGREVSIKVNSDREIDPRLARYVDRSDIFSGARVEVSDDGRSAVITADVVSLYFVMGTDANGRDLLARILVSLRISMLIGVLATVVALTIGVIYGATAGFIGGRLDAVMMRFVDVLYALPYIFFVILLVVFFGQNLVLMFLAVGAVEWLDMARIVRGQTLSLRRREFVQAAEALGASSLALIRRHIIPNTLGTVVIYMTLLVPKVILLESFLSFLGLGVQEPLSSLGVLIADGANNMRSAGYMLFWPAAAMVVLLFALNFLGDGLRDALDPKDR